MTNNQQRLHPAVPWIIWGLACAFYFYEFFVQVSPSVMVPELMQDFGVSATSLGMLTGVYFYSYAAMQLPVGVLLDRLGPRLLLTFAALVCGFGSALFAMAHNLFTAEIARFSIGIGSAVAVIGAMKITANWFPAKRFALLTGLLVAIGMLGAMGGESPLAMLVDNIGWRQSMGLLAVVGVLFAIAIALVIRDHPPHHQETKQKEAQQQPMLAGLKQVLRNKRIWLLAVYGGLMYAPTPTFCGLWGVPFLMHEYSLARPVAAAIISLVFVGWAIGSPFWGWFSNFIGRRLPPMIIGAIASLSCLLVVIYIPQLNRLSLEIALFGFGFFSSGFLPAFAMAKEISDPSYTATTLSFMNMMNMIGVALLQPAIGYLLDYHWSGEMMLGVRVYQLADYRAALDLLAFSLLLAIAVLPFIKETYCHQYHTSNKKKSDNLLAAGSNI